MQTSIFRRDGQYLPTITQGEPMFQPGDTVVYRHHVCTIIGIRENYYEGNDYFELKTLFGNPLKLFIATHEAKPPALRCPMTRKEALALIDSITDTQSIDESALEPEASTPTLLERRVKEEYEKHLKTFQPCDLVPIIKSVHERTEQRKEAGRRITAVDKKYFEMAEKLLCDELSVSLDISRDEVKDFLIERVKKTEEQKQG